MEADVLIARSEMPQISESELPAFVAFAAARGVAIEQEVVSANGLLHRQAVSMAHALQIPAAKLNKPSLVSSDNYILDGNHRVAGSRARNVPVSIYRVDLPFDEALALMFAFPGVYRSSQPIAHELVVPA